MACISDQHCVKCGKITAHLDGRCRECDVLRQQSGGIIMPDRIPVDTETLRRELERARAAAFWCFVHLTDHNDEIALESWPDIANWGKPEPDAASLKAAMDAYNRGEWEDLDDVIEEIEETK